MPAPVTASTCSSSCDADDRQGGGLAEAGRGQHLQQACCGGGRRGRRCGLQHPQHEGQQREDAQRRGRPSPSAVVTGRTRLVTRTPKSPSMTTTSPRLTGLSLTSTSTGASAGRSSCSTEPGARPEQGAQGERDAAELDGQLDLHVGQQPQVDVAVGAGRELELLDHGLLVLVPAGDVLGGCRPRGDLDGGGRDRRGDGRRVGDLDRAGEHVGELVRQRHDRPGRTSETTTARWSPRRPSRAESTSRSPSARGRTPTSESGRRRVQAQHVAGGELVEVGGADDGRRQAQGDGDGHVAEHAVGRAAARAAPARARRAAASGPAGTGRRGRCSPLGSAASSSTATTSPVPAGSGSSVTSCAIEAVDAVLGQGAGERAQRRHEVAHEQASARARLAGRSSGSPSPPMSRSASATAPARGTTSRQVPGRPHDERGPDVAVHGAPRRARPGGRRRRWSATVRPAAAPSSMPTRGTASVSADDEPLGTRRHRQRVAEVEQRGSGHVHCFVGRGQPRPAGTPGTISGMVRTGWHAGAGRLRRGAAGAAAAAQWPPSAAGAAGGAAAGAAGAAAGRRAGAAGAGCGTSTTMSTRRFLASEASSVPLGARVGVGVPGGGQPAGRQVLARR